MPIVLPFSLLCLPDDVTSPLAKAADSFELKPVVGHKPEDGEGGIGFDIVPKPGKEITPELLKALGATLAAQILDENDNCMFKKSIIAYSAHICFSCPRFCQGLGR